MLDGTTCRCLAAKQRGTAWQLLRPDASAVERLMAQRQDASWLQELSGLVSQRPFLGQLSITSPLKRLHYLANRQALAEDIIQLVETSPAAYRLPTELARILRQALGKPAGQLESSLASAFNQARQLTIGDPLQSFLQQFAFLLPDERASAIVDILAKIAPEDLGLFVSALDDPEVQSLSHLRHLYPKLPVNGIAWAWVTAGGSEELIPSWLAELGLQVDHQLLIAQWKEDLPGLVVETSQLYEQSLSCYSQLIFDPEMAQTPAGEMPIPSTSEVGMGKLEIAVSWSAAGTPMDLFNRTHATREVPYIRFGQYHRINEEVTHYDVIVPSESSLPFRRAERQDRLLVTLWTGSGDPLNATKQSYLKLEMPFTVGMVSDQAVMEGTFEVRIDNPSQELIQRLADALDIEIKSALILSPGGRLATRLSEGQGYDDLTFTHLATLDRCLGNFVYLDESDRPLSVMRKAIFRGSSPIDRLQDRNEQLLTFWMACGEEAGKLSLIDRATGKVEPPTDSYLNLSIERADSGMEHFAQLFPYLLAYYLRRRGRLISLYYPSVEVSCVKRAVAPLRQRRPRLASLGWENGILRGYASIATYLKESGGPDFFPAPVKASGESWTRHCQRGKNEQLSLLDGQRVAEYDDSGYITIEGDRYNVICIPRGETAERRWCFACVTKGKMKHPGVLKLIYRTSSTDPALDNLPLPCCYSVDQTVRGGSYRGYLEGREESLPAVTSRPKKALKPLRPGQGGELPSDFIALLREVELAEYSRRGVESSNLLSCLAAALSERISAERLASEVENNQWLWMAGRQELFDLSQAEVADELRTGMITYQRHYRLLEEIFQINLFGLEVIEGSALEPMLPRHQLWHAREQPVYSSTVLVIVYPDGVDLVVRKDGQDNGYHSLFGNDIARVMAERLTAKQEIVTIGPGGTKLNTHVMSVAFLQENFPNIELVAQRVDSYGKLRSLTIRLDGKQLEVFPNPTFPLPLPEQLDAIEPPNRDWLISQLGEPSAISTVTVAKDGGYSSPVVGLWYPFGGAEAGFYFPVRESEWTTTLPVITAPVQHTSGKAGKDTSGKVGLVTRYTQLEMIRDDYLRCLSWLFFADKLARTGDTVSWLIGRLVIGPANYDFSKLPYHLPPAISGEEAYRLLSRKVPNVFTASGILVESQEMLDGVSYYIQRLDRTLSDEEAKLTLKSRFRFLDQFGRIKHEALVTSMQLAEWQRDHLARRELYWDDERLVNNMRQTLSQGLSASTQPLFYREEYSFFLIQNVHSRSDAVALSHRMNSDHVNRPELTREVAPQEIPHTTYEIDANGHLAESALIARRNASISILAYNDGTYAGMWLL